MNRVDRAEVVDPITTEVIRNKLEGIANEMELTLLKSSFSPIVKEGLDTSASLFTVNAETLAQACAIPVHLATLIPGKCTTLLDTACCALYAGVASSCQLHQLHSMCIAGPLRSCKNPYVDKFQNDSSSQLFKFQ